MGGLIFSCSGNVTLHSRNTAFFSYVADVSTAAKAVAWFRNSKTYNDVPWRTRLTRRCFRYPESTQSPGSTGEAANSPSNRTRATAARMISDTKSPASTRAWNAKCHALVESERVSSPREHPRRPAGRRLLMLMHTSSTASTYCTRQAGALVDVGQMVGRVPKPIKHAAATHPPIIHPLSGRSDSSQKCAARWQSGREGRRENDMRATGQLAAVAVGTAFMCEPREENVYITQQNARLLLVAVGVHSLLRSARTASVGVRES
ncbi:hypothetical protein BKA81DRAFT_394921 [Phyllosticta paracitricarpa]|uniref:Uncharacterized protein n=1 Tax=Phyllosticta citricarpa TaxID=55181 RepID=A0ABR1MQH9_9PEZI